MSIITEYVETKWSGPTKKYYIELGYRYTKLFDILIVRAEHLKPGSSVKIDAKCDKCGSVRNISFNDYTDVCHPCSGEKISNTISEKMKDPFYSDKRRKLSSNTMKKTMSDEKNRKRASEHGKKLFSRLNSDADFQKRRIEKSRAAIEEKVRNGELNFKLNKTKEEREERRIGRDLQRWRDGVYERDLYTCQMCFDSSGGNLNAHHLNGYNWFMSGRFDINNGITLCKSCRTDFHKKYGYSNSTVEQFEEYRLKYGSK